MNVRDPYYLITIGKPPKVYKGISYSIQSSSIVIKAEEMIKDFNWLDKYVTSPRTTRLTICFSPYEARKRGVYQLSINFKSVTVINVRMMFVCKYREGV